MHRDNRKMSDGAVLKAVLQDMSEAVLVKSPAGTIAIWNRAAAELFGYTAPEVVGERAEILIPSGEQRYWRDVEKRLRGGDIVRQVRAVRLSKKRERIRVLLTAIITDKRDAAYSEIVEIYRRVNGDE
jgi:PAS domain S-box-containing protein